MTTNHAILVDGYYTQYDGGGGYFVYNGTSGATACTPTVNNGTIIEDHAGNCFQRVDPPTDVRQWGAKCDVTTIGPGAVWIRSANAISILSASIPAGTLSNPLQFLDVTQIGPATPSPSGSIPPTWADRWSTLSAAGSTYHVGDLIAFQGSGGTTPPYTGVFSQQVTISVDQVNGGASGSGAITKWHFVTGGQYTQLPAPATTPAVGLVQDSAHSCLGPLPTGGGCATSGYDTAAQLNAQWAGWSVMDTGTTLSVGGTGHSIGDILTFDVSGGTTLSSHYPKLLVMNIDTPTNGAITAWQWLDYGSYSIIPTGGSLPIPLVEQSCGTHTCAQMIPEWTRGTLATTISSVAQFTNSNCTGTLLTTYTCIYPNDIPVGVPDQAPIEAFYYGDDDGTQINNAISNSINGAAVHISGFCGTTQTIKLNDKFNPIEPTNVELTGDSYKTSGLFAFAYDLGHRTANPLMNHLVYRDSKHLAYGGGIRDLEIDGMGVPQGSGYYSNGSSVPVPLGFGGATYCNTAMPPVCIPSSGSVVEIDSAKESFFNNLAVYDAYGEGNAEFQGGLHDADPTLSFKSDFGSSFMYADRFDVLNNQYGALDPEFALDFQTAHDSQFSNLVAFDGTEADIFQQGGNIYSGVHVESNAFNGGVPQYVPAVIPAWKPPPPTSTPPFAGMATYGLESTQNLTLSNFQCDGAWAACIFLGESAGQSSDTPSAISNVTQKCSGFLNVWPTYYGVEAANGTAGTAISNVISYPSCQIPTPQLIFYDNPLDGVKAASQDYAAQYCSPARGYTANRYYTMPFTSTGSSVLTAGILYAIPMPIVCAVTITQLSFHVMNSVTSTCELGIYGDNGTGEPGPLIVDAGGVSFTLAPNTNQSKSMYQQLSPGMVFLVIGCSSTAPALLGGSTTGTLLGNLIGLGSQTDTNAVITAAWSGGTLPPTFPTVVFGVSTNPAPLVFMRP